MASITSICLIILCATFHISESSSPLLSSKIVGGKESGRQGKKFMVSLQIRKKHFCCGFLASWRIAISTGSCIEYIVQNGGFALIHATVFYGSIYLHMDNNRHRAQIDHVNWHPKFDPKNYNEESSYDIGYVLVKSELMLPIFRLTTLQFKEESIPTKKHIYTYGWGSEQIEEPGKASADTRMSMSLKEIEIRPEDPRRCADALGRDIRHDEICMRGDRQNKTCGLGDAGSPIVRRVNIVCGIASVVNIQKNNHPIVFIRIAPYIPYIQSLMDKYPCKQKNKVTHSERRQLAKTIRESRRAANACNERSDDPNQESAELPGLNRALKDEDEELPDWNESVNSKDENTSNSY